MKHILRMVLILTLLLGICALARAEVGEPAKLYEMGQDQDTMTVWLAANETTGYEWQFEISDEKLLELVTFEYVPGDENKAEGHVGAGGYWAGSFRSLVEAEGAGGRVTLTLRYVRPWEPHTVEPAEGVAFDIWVMENGQMQVDGIWRLENVAPLEP